MTPPIAGPNEGLNSAVAAELRAEQGRQRLSVADVAERADIPYGSLRRYLNAERHIDVSVLAAVCAAMGVNPGDVIADATAGMIAREKANPGDVILFPGRAAKTVVVREVSVDEDNIEDLYDEPSAAHPLPRNDVEGEVDPDLQ